jgi:hypothetical protein
MHTASHRHHYLSITFYFRTHALLLFKIRPSTSGAPAKAIVG